MNNSQLHVEIAQVKAAISPTELISLGLGSCVGVCLYDPITKVGGLAHVMLPESAEGHKTEFKGKYADTAIPTLIIEMLKLGASKKRLVAKIAGGAQMFNFSNTSELMCIGERNVKAVIEALEKEKIPIISQDTGMNYGRSIKLCTNTGLLYIKSMAHNEKVL
ncbi:MAG: chemotaxis protein CheD [Syntrophaceticus sp.]